MSELTLEKIKYALETPGGRNFIAYDTVSHAYAEVVNGLREYRITVTKDRGLFDAADRTTLRLHQDNLSQVGEVVKSKVLSSSRDSYSLSLFIDAYPDPDNYLYYLILFSWAWT